MRSEERGPAHKPLKRGLTVMLLALAGALLVACGGGGGDALSVGDDAPDFALPTASGSSVSLQDYEGEQPVLLYFHMALG